MGQYYVIANIDKKELLHPHKFDSGMKILEMLFDNRIHRALTILLTNCPESRGGGDFSDAFISKWHDYIGRWIGDRIVVIGDYAESKDLRDKDIDAEFVARSVFLTDDYYTNISDKMIELLDDLVNE